jgi:hypothetical protein
MAENKRSVLISENLYEKIKKHVEHNQSEFNNVDEYIEITLNEFMNVEEEAEHTPSSAEQEKIKERLRKLGYL